MLTDDFTFVHTNKPFSLYDDHTRLIHSQEKLETLMHSIKNGEAFGVSLEFALLEAMSHIILLSKEITKK